MMVTLRGHMQLETAFRIEPTPLSKKGRVFPSSFLPPCFLNSSRITELDRNTLQFLSDNFLIARKSPIIISFLCEPVSHVISRKRKRKKRRNPRNAAELNLNLRQRENIDAAKKRNPSRKY